MKILIIEDEHAARRAMEQYLRIAGFEVAAVGTPEDALATAPTFDADVLVLDWELGAELDGVDVARELQHDGSPELIFITGQSLADLRRESTDLDVRAYFQKPVSLREIAQILEPS